MEIIYLKQVKENPKLRGFINEPMSITEIEALENKYNKGGVFPKAFREYLFLAGNFNNLAFDDLGEGLNELQKLANEELAMVGQKVDRPFFAFSVYNSQYSVIFLDESEEDPKVYLISPFLAKGGSEPLVKPNGWIFSELVNESIRRVNNNIPF